MGQEIEEFSGFSPLSDTHEYRLMTAIDYIVKEIMREYDDFGLLKVIMAILKRTYVDFKKDEDGRKFHNYHAIMKPDDFQELTGIEDTEIIKEKLLKAQNLGLIGVRKMGEGEYSFYITDNRGEV